MRATLGLIAKTPTVLRGPRRALANKLCKAGLAVLVGDQYEVTTSGRALLGVGLTKEQADAVSKDVKSLLHASRDCLRNRGVDTTSVPWHTNDPYYAEAFGILRCLVVLGLGKFGAVNHNDTVNSWFWRLCDEVLLEENFGGTNECEHCRLKYGKDGTGRVR